MIFFLCFFVPNLRQQGFSICIDWANSYRHSSGLGEKINTDKFFVQSSVF
jgi:hypothetical protein